MGKAWQPTVGGGVLGLWVPLLSADWAIVVGFADTIKRRKSKKISAKGCYYGPVHSMIHTGGAASADSVGADRQTSREELRPAAFFSTELTLSPVQSIK